MDAVDLESEERPLGLLGSVAPVFARPTSARFALTPNADTPISPISSS